MSNEIVTQPEHGDTIVSGDGVAAYSFQVFLDEIVLALNLNLLGQAVKFPSSTVEDLPEAVDFEGAGIFVSNEAGGSVLAYSDGVNWRRVTDGAIVTA